MSITDSDHLRPARERHGAHYKMLPREGDGALVPAMIFRVGEINPEDKICQNCWRTPFSNETEICPRCGAKIED
jgi:hypothetical protein